MTQPRSEASTTPSNGAPQRPVQAPPLTDEQLRLQCIQLAVSARVDSRYVTASAERFLQYIKTGSPNSGETKIGMGA